MSRAAIKSPFIGAAPEGDAEKDEYTCQAGQKLRAKYVGKRASKSGFESEITYYACDDCSGCPFKKTCTRAKGNRQIGSIPKSV